jgi:peptidoglycan/xylan/chitin deacetylase (PgdA/CDA1 family)
MRLAALSVDLDEIPSYFAIHGLAEPSASSPSASAVYDAGLGRLDAFARAVDVPLTLFAIGRDLARPENAEALRAFADRGHAVENHSLDHRYDLVRLAPAEITRQVQGGADAVERATGRRPTGFRAPGYTMTDEVFDALEQLGVAWDSSVFPCPAYYGAKALVLGAQRVRGRVSASILDTPRVLTAPTRPYRPGRPYTRRGDRRVVELPIQVTPGLRLPVIGTSLGLAGPAGARALGRRCASEPLVNVELHGLDFVDASDAPGLDVLAKHQPELRRHVDRRILAVAELVRELRANGYAFVRLDEAARSVAV